MSRKMMHSKRKILVMLKLGFRCHYCGLDFLQSPEHFHLSSVDHVIPRSKGGSDSLDNLVSACSLCNFLKGSRGYTSLEAARESIQHRRKKYLESFYNFLFNAPYFPHERLDGIQAQALIDRIWNPQMLHEEVLAFETEQ
jgi:hypothetical protein